MARRTTRGTVETCWDGEVISSLAHEHSGKSADGFSFRLKALLETEGSLRMLPSARRGIQWFLESALDPRDGCVLACSINCAVVGEAVRNAGLRLKTFDLAEPTGRIDWESVARALGPEDRAIIIPHFYGVPTDFRPILETCRERGILILEDCAHTLGGRLDGQVAGTLGDAAVFSFNYDKPLSLGWGGALLVNDAALARRVKLPEIETPDSKLEMRHLAVVQRWLARDRKSIGRGKSLRTRVERRLGIDGKMPVPLLGVGPLRAALGSWQLERYAELVTARSRNAELLAARAEAYRSWHVDPAASPAWLKQRVITRQPERGAECERALQQRGFQVGRINWGKTLDADCELLVPGLTDGCPNATRATELAIDVPIHQNVTREEVEAIARTLNGDGPTP